MDLQLSRDHARRIVELIDGIGDAAMLCNVQGVAGDSKERININQVVEVSADQETLQQIADCAAMLVEQHFSYRDVDHLIHDYETIFNFIPAQIWYKDTKNKFIRVNKQVEKDLGMAVSEFAGRSAEELFPAYADQYYRDDLEVITSRKPKLGIIEQITTNSGENHWVKMNKIPIFHEDGSVSGLIVLGIDITERRKMEEQRSIWGTIFDNSREPMSVTDSNNKFVTVNQAFCEATGYSLQEVVGRDPRMLKSGHHDAVFYQNMWAAITQAGSWQGEVWERRKDGTIYIKWLKIHRITDSQGKLINYTATFTDITEQKAAAERITYLDRHDALTGLVNRMALGEALDAAIQNASSKKSSVGIISIDLDRFKNINDSLGHKFGDKFLQEIARRLESLGSDGSITGRFGGDAFIVILPDIHNESETIAAINKRIDVITQPFLYGEVELVVTASMGISIFPEDGDTAEVLIRNADTAMHKAKDNVSNSYRFFTATMNEYASERLILENGLRRAVERNEFVLAYQPQLDAETEQVIGVEALIRWQHPTGGMVSPLDFIPLAEQSGLIIPIGEWVLLEACRQHCYWLEMGFPPIPISVNISAVQFHDKGFLQMLATVIEKSGIEPSYLDLEVTESVVMRDPKLVIKQLEKIKAMGIKLSLDDFGTGFSSFSYLKHFPLDRLKIDKSFVHDLVTEPINQAIIQSIIVLGRNLKLQTIAEGVETAEELHCLQELQCDAIQGYYYSKPLSSSDFIKWFRCKWEKL